MILDRLEAGLPVTVYVLDPTPDVPCQRPTYTGAVAGYPAGCRCRRCVAAWRSYRREYYRGRRLPMGRLYGRPVAGVTADTLGVTAPAASGDDDVTPLAYDDDDA
jgi:hypothetical protein